jgi:hypothetical protein
MAVIRHSDHYPPAYLQFRVIRVIVHDSCG